MRTYRHSNGAVKVPEYTNLVMHTMMGMVFSIGIGLAIRAAQKGLAMVDPAGVRFLLEEEARNGSK